MGICNSLCSSLMLTDQITHRIFEILPERGPLILIMDADGNSRSSNPEEYARLNVDESFLQDICVAIDDGVEPVVTSSNDCGVFAGQLATEENNYGYVFILIPKYTPESTLLNIDLIEMLLNQICFIAELVEKNNLHYNVQMKQYSLWGQSKSALN